MEQTKIARTHTAKQEGRSTGGASYYARISNNLQANVVGDFEIGSFCMFYNDGDPKSMVFFTLYIQLLF